MSRNKTSTNKPAGKTPAKPAAKPKAANPDLVPLEKATAPKPSKSTRAAKPERMSALDAAARVLAESREPLSCPQLIQAMEAKGYWKSPGGKTPAATLSSAIQRELKTRGNQARFKKIERGQFALAKGA